MSIFDYFLFSAAIVLLASSIYLSFKTGFVQIRMLPSLFRALLSTESRSDRISKGTHTLVPKKALYTAMSTTLGLGTIVSPIIALRLGGPGVLIGYLLTTFFGSALTFVEVSSAVTCRKKLASGGFSGGPMSYLEGISKNLARWYALLCMTVMAAWSGAQANQLAAFFASPLVSPFHVPLVLTGVLTGLLVLFMLVMGIKWIAKLSTYLVPVMFVLYVGSCLLIISMNVDKMLQILSIVITSCCLPYTLSTGVLIGGLTSALRWGIFKGVHSNEAGLGTQTFPHSVAETKDPEQQGMLAMASTFSSGLVAILGGLVAMITETWQNDQLPLGIAMVSKSFEMYFSWIGIGIIGVCALLFSIGTILGNSYNGSMCFLYLTRQRLLYVYFVAIAFMVAWGAVSSVTTFWAFSDLLVALMAIPHAFGLVWLTMQKQTAFAMSSTQKN